MQALLWAKAKAFAPCFFRRYSAGFGAGFGASGAEDPTMVGLCAI